APVAAGFPRTARIPFDRRALIVISAVLFNGPASRHHAAGESGSYGLRDRSATAALTEPSQIRQATVVRKWDHTGEIIAARPDRPYRAYPPRRIDGRFAVACSLAESRHDPRGFGPAT